SMATGVWFNQWNWRLFFELAYATPHYTPLYVWPAVALVFALVLIVAIGRGAKTEGFERAEYKKFIRGTRVVSAKSLRRLCLESVPQIEVGTIPMPTKVENLHLMIGGATGSGKSILLRKMAATVQKRGERMFMIDPNKDLMSRFYK